MLGAIILTHDDSLRCLEQARRLHSYNCFDEIVIVDNKSDKENINILMSLTLDKVTILYLSENKGYGAGNNVGIKHLLNKGFTHALLINNDIEMSKQTILDCYKFIKQDNKCAVVSPKLIEKGKLKRNFYDIPNLKNTLNFISSTFGKKCKSMEMHENYFKVDFVRESSAIYNLKALADVDYFDENIFLFEEGATLGYKLKSKGYYEAIVTNTNPCIHRHVGPIINRKLFAINKKSRMYFFKNYLHYGKFKLLIFRIYWLNIFIK